MRCRIFGAIRAAGVAVLTFTGAAHAGPYAPAAGQAGSTAIDNDSPSFVSWATGQTYAPGTGVSSPFNVPANALGPAEGTNFDIVSLGDGGQITLTFAAPIADGAGADFAVFENSFSDTFLELAWVEVSNDGTNFVRFPNDSLTANPVPFLGGAVDPTNIDGLAGKYRAGFGTPFDLSAVGLSQVTHVRLVDIIGNGTALDTSGDIIYDPFPTTGSAGFDLDGVGVIHQVPEPAGLALGLLLPLAAMARRRRGRAAAVFALALVVSAVSAPSTFAQTATFDDLTLAPNSFYNGSNGAGDFTSGGASFRNTYNTDFGVWSGFAYSNTTDTTTAGFTNQYSAIPGIGADASANYGIGTAFGPGEAVITLPAGRSASSVSLTNTTYAYLSMRDGDSFAKKFGGASGNDADFFKLTITGLDAADASIGSIDFYLADFRFTDNAQDYLIDEWTSVDLTSLAAARKLSFSLSSSDNHPIFGMNTPAYFAIDNLATVPEPAALALLGAAALLLAGRRRA